MATVVMPLFSLWAKGTLGKNVTYRRSMGKFVVSAYERIPKVWSDSQKAVREQFRQKAERYRLFLLTDPATWPETMHPDYFNIPEV